MRLLNARHNKWRFFLGVSFCALAAMLLPDALINFRYDRTALLAGQWWRIVTAHVVHLNAWHLLLNLFGLFLICELLWRDLPWAHGCALLLFSAAGISALLWWFHPGLAWYAGLSGALHGLWGGCALRGWWRLQFRAKTAATDGAVIYISEASTPYFFIGALILLALKVGLEAVYGPSPHTGRMIDGPVISIAHLYGALAGIAYVLIWRGISGSHSRE